MSDSPILHKQLSRRTFLYGASAVAGLGALALSGCGSFFPGGWGDEESTQAKIKGTLAYSARNYDPVGQTNAASLSVIWHVYEGLYEIDMHTFEPYCALAAGDPVKISDYKYNITLRDNAKFSNGAQVTANDVVVSIGANIADQTYCSYIDFLKSAEFVDKKTVAINLKYPFESLLKQRLSIIKIFRGENGDSISQKKIGSGPWDVSKFDGSNGGIINFFPNNNYNGPHGVPQDSMSWKVQTKQDERCQTILDKKSYVIESVPDNKVDTLKDAGVTVEYKQGLSMAMLIFNTLKEPFNSKDVRQALFYAIDTNSICKDTFNDHATLATSLLSEVHPNYNRADPVFDYNPQKAQQLLKDAGYEHFEFQLWVGTSWVTTLAGTIKENLEKIGVTCNIRNEDVTWDTLGESNDVLPFDVILAPADPAVFGADADLVMSMWYGDNIWTIGRTCWKKAPGSRWQELQEMLMSARTAPEGSQQAIWNQCYNLIADQVPMYPILHRQIATGYYSDKFSGYSPIPSTGLDFLGVKSN